MLTEQGGKNTAEHDSCIRITELSRHAGKKRAARMVRTHTASEGSGAVKPAQGYDYLRLWL